MNFKRFLLSAVCVFVFIFLYEYLMQGVLLHDLYTATASVWRSLPEMEAMWPLFVGYQLVLALWGAFAFSQLYPTGGIKKGLLFGLFFGVFAGLLTASWYLWLNVPALLAVYWFWISVGEGLGAGILYGLLYRKR